jgi:hypothetical protein
MNSPMFRKFMVPEIHEPAVVIGLCISKRRLGETRARAECNKNKKSYFFHFEIFRKRDLRLRDSFCNVAP